MSRYINFLLCKNVEGKYEMIKDFRNSFYNTRIRDMFNDDPRDIVENSCHKLIFNPDTEKLWKYDENYSHKPYFINFSHIELLKEKLKSELKDLNNKLSYIQRTQVKLEDLLMEYNCIKNDKEELNNDYEALIKLEAVWELIITEMDFSKDNTIMVWWID